MNPRIGFVTCVHPIYNLPSVTQHRDEAVSALRADGCEVVATDIARDSRHARSIAGFLQSEQVDMVLFFFCTWVAEEITLSLARELDDIPLLLWALPYLDRNVPMPSPVTGLVATGSNIRRLGRSYAHMVGGVTPEHVHKAARAARAAAVVTRLRNARFGIIGHPCPGMIDTGCDELALQKCLGATVVHRDLDNLLRAAGQSDPREASDLAAQLVSRTGSNEVDPATIAEQYRLFLGMKSMVEADGLDGFTVRCWPELRDQHRLTVCLTLSEMAEAGVPNACESDLTALVTSYVLTQFAGAPSYSFDISGYFEEEQALQFAHCGSAALSLAGEAKCTAIRGHMRTGAGALVEFGFRPGTATIAKLLQPQDGRMKMFVGRGEIVATRPEVRGSVATIRVEPSPAAFLDKLMHEAVEHHLVVAHGDWTADLAQFCEFSGIELIKP